MNKILLLLSFAFVAISSHEIDWQNIKNAQMSRVVDVPSNNELPIIHPRILNGHTVDNIEKFAYQAGLLVKSKISLQWCGGSVISSQWILTAAHCLWEAEAADVYLGFIDRMRRDPDTLLIRVPKEDIIMHKLFDHVHNYYDVGLVRLRDPIKFNKSIQPISLVQTKDANNFDNKMVTLSGWGLTNDKELEAHRILQTTTISILPNNECQKKFYSFGRPLGATDTSTLICSNPKLNTGVCEGDSGGGAVVQLNDKPTLIGINAFIVFDKKSLCEHVHVRMLTRVASYLDWICLNSGICPE